MFRRSRKNLSDPPALSKAIMVLGVYGDKGLMLAQKQTSSITLVLRHTMV